MAQRLRLFTERGLGAGNFFWHAWKVASDRDRPLLFHPDVDSPTWEEEKLEGLSLDDIRVTVIRYAHWYREHGVTTGSHVGVITRHGLFGLLHHIAVTSLGATAVHCNPRMAPATAAEYFLRTETRLVIGDDTLLEACTQAWTTAGKKDTPRLQDIHALDADARAPRRPLPGFPHPHSTDDLIMISHSSGTTGRPKAPVFHHGSFFRGKRERLWTFPSRRTDRLLTALPHSHSAGISYLSMAILLGIPTLILDDADGEKTVRAINVFHPTTVLGFPLTLAEIDPGKILPEAAQDIHTWNGMGDASHERHVRPLVALGRRGHGAKKTPGSVYLDGLGSSEMGMVLFKQAYTTQTSNYGRLIGTPARVVRSAAVLDASGRHAPAGQAGRLGVRTPSVTPGYWDDPQLNQDSLVNGYFLTGDIVRRDTEGRWYHLDRTTDVINSATGEIYSLPLEEVVLMTTGALDAAVVAVDGPGTSTTQVPAAVVHYADDTERTPAEVLLACNAALDRAGLARLHALVLTAARAELPVGVTGKVLKRQLRETHRRLLHEPTTDAVAITVPDGPPRTA
ncbi:class I adenylate-forming enzyme family protein [Streptomyces spiramenti]|uniref:class I adenylate-forming enzyme family protein n=1 Tax=Streptomyces spiramenti TaxID=2720606 RepID=UPI0030840A68